MGASSVALHEALGFGNGWTMPAVAVKGGHVLDVVYLTLQLAPMKPEL